MTKDWDVIVVGGGPGGAAAARKCAGAGLRTLLLEKQLMPRDKVCSGMVMGRWAQTILREQFGQIPEEVLVAPKSLLGYAVHVPGAPIQTIDVDTPITWRKRLDTWMCERASEAGTQVMDGVRVTSVTEENGRYLVRTRGEGQSGELRTRFVVGADGAMSSVRASLFPELKPVYWHCYRECYDVALDLPERRFNFFSTLETAPFYFCTHEKDGFLLMEGGAQIGTIKETAAGSRRYLIEHHGLTPETEPLWRDACVEPILYQGLFSGTFRPASENALLVGDAAGLNMPVTGEGVGTALKSGRDAADAMVAAAATGATASEAYLATIDDLLRRYKEIYAHSRQIKSAAATGDPKALSDALLSAWDRALRLF